MAAKYTTQGLRRAAELIRRRMLVDVEINIKDPSYPWFLYWMTQHERQRLADGVVQAAATEKLGRIERIVHRFLPRMRQLAVETTKHELPNGAIQTRFSLIPGPGKHFLLYNNAIIHVNRQREGNKIDHHTGLPWETTTLTTLYSHRHVFEAMFKEAHSIAQSTMEGKTAMYISRSIGWEKFGEPRRKRPLDSVILEKGVKERIVSDIQDFIASADWYQDRGIPYRRGYLLYGPPGTGKSSFIQALAGHLDYDIAMINLSERGLTDDRLNHLLLNLPKRTLALLEDVDAAFANRRQTDTDGYSGANVTFSGLLNALDGVASAEERILFLTTNHVERLDEALVRPGRVDMTVKIGQATAYQVGQLWDRFYGEFDSDGTKKRAFLQRLLELKILTGLEDHAASVVSTASLQGLFVYNKDSPERALEMAEHLVPGESPAEMLLERERQEQKL